MDGVPAVRSSRAARKGFDWASEPPSPPAVVSVLDDPQCRDLLAALDEPRGVKDLAEAAAVPLSTTSREVTCLW